MPGEWNKMDKKSYYQLLIILSTINTNSQDYDRKINNITADITEMIESMMDQIKNSKLSLDNKYWPKAQYSTTAVPSNRKYLPLDCGHSTKNWWHVESQTWDQLTKILWTTHQDRNQILHCSGPQELLQAQQYVSQFGDYNPRIPSSWLTAHQKTF